MNSTELLDLDIAREHVRWHLAEGDIQKVAGIALDVIREAETLRTALAAIRADLGDHIANLSDKQPWDNRAAFDRTYATACEAIGAER